MKFILYYFRVLKFLIYIIDSKQFIFWLCFELNNRKQINLRQVLVFCIDLSLKIISTNGKFLLTYSDNASGIHNSSVSDVPSAMLTKIPNVTNIIASLSTDFAYPINKIIRIQNFINNTSNQKNADTNMRYIAHIQYWITEKPALCLTEILNVRKEDHVEHNIQT